MPNQQRQFYRILYPQIERPSITVSGTTYEVVDLCEAGVCFTVPVDFRPTVGIAVHGEIRFRNGKTCDIAGTVIRVNEDEHTCILHLTLGVPLHLVMEQQRYLLKKYPKVIPDKN